MTGTEVVVSASWLTKRYSTVDAGETWKPKSVSLKSMR